MNPACGFQTPPRSLSAATLLEEDLMFRRECVNQIPDVSGSCFKGGAPLEAGLLARRRFQLAESVRSVVLLLPSLIATFFVCPPVNAQFIQQGGKLVGTGSVGSANQGCSVAISKDGNTVLVGGCADNGNVGAAWVFTRSGGLWSQQGSKLVGTGTIGGAGSGQGLSVALSGDGNTALVGSPNDNGDVGAAWVFTRSGSVWTQGGTKLVGTGSVGTANQGISVALSLDGNTAIVGGFFDNKSPGGLAVGAVWVYTRVGGVWSQQGGKLVGSGATNSAEQGFSVALSGDGNTLIEGGPFDRGNAGTVWVFTRSGGVWSQQSQLVGRGGSTFPNGAWQGSSVALSEDGNTAIEGGNFDSGYAGAAWVFTRSGSVWTQEGSKLVGTGAIGGTANQGASVALSADGNTALVGGLGDNGGAGAMWVYARAGGVWSQQSKLFGKI